eukprot:Sspe_Gene.53654::Locus_29636_Transcript_1_1_Confidence_1.000_Length_691::g.53654::m.53654
MYFPGYFNLPTVTWGRWNRSLGDPHKEAVAHMYQVSKGLEDICADGAELKRHGQVTEISQWAAKSRDEAGYRLGHKVFDSIDEQRSGEVDALDIHRYVMGHPELREKMVGLHWGDFCTQFDTRTAKGTGGVAEFEKAWEACSFAERLGMEGAAVFRLLAGERGSTVLTTGEVEDVLQKRTTAANKVIAALSENLQRMWYRFFALAESSPM